MANIGLTEVSGMQGTNRQGSNEQSSVDNLRAVHSVGANGLGTLAVPSN